jgi:hypothetical protein
MVNRRRFIAAALALPAAWRASGGSAFAAPGFRARRAAGPVA